ncbi:unnamed protein product [Lactuca saligna]|uniref:Uncharacterized protein n=1 Tax=Lactuca saligna TaxID=75948 RepID=A0AA35VET4_LACSI|nr:unnamed protein product [Lactuca saligna]
MEVDKEQHEDIHDYNTKYELDDGNQEYDSHTENGENKDIQYNSQSDSEEEIHKTVPTKSGRKRGMTRLPKLKTEYVNSGGKKTCQIEENVISKEEIPPRSVMWCKGRESKGEFKDQDVKIMADKLMEHEKQIKEGQVNVEPGMDAMTLVFGKEKGRFLKGVGMGVTYNRYFIVPRSKGSSKEEIKDLKVALHNGKA